MKYNFNFCTVHKNQSLGRGTGKSKPVICIETGKRYPSAAAAARENHTYRSNISTVIKGGRLKTAGGFHWRRAEK